ncbi:hypothetical protein LSAT2_002475 [Lamellibrachia satsuma]|nr:hypothetical protein LSAT2_002475 [Lamellibrachia satsuma]
MRSQQDSFPNHLSTSEPMCMLGSQDANNQPINQHEKLGYCNPIRNSHAGDIVLRLQTRSSTRLPIVPASVLETTQQMQNAMPRSKIFSSKYSGGFLVRVPLRTGVEATGGGGVSCIATGSSLGGDSYNATLISERGGVRDIEPASRGSGSALISHGSLSGSGRFSSTTRR